MVTVHGHQVVHARGGGGGAGHKWRMQVLKKEEARFSKIFKITDFGWSWNF